MVKCNTQFKTSIFNNYMLRTVCFIIYIYFFIVFILSLYNFVFFNFIKSLYITIPISVPIVLKITSSISHTFPIVNICSISILKDAKKPINVTLDIFLKLGFIIGIKNPKGININIFPTIFLIGFIIGIVLSLKVSIVSLKGIIFIKPLKPSVLYIYVSNGFMNSKYGNLNNVKNSSINIYKVNKAI